MSKALNTAVREVLVRKIAARLDFLFPPPLPPCLNSSSPFQFLCAVVLSAQTTDGKVNAVTDELFKIGGDPYTMSAIPTEVIASTIKTLGLSQAKARYLKGLSEMIVKDFMGSVPETLQSLMKLPGVGRKTASVVISQVHGQNAFPVDTHIHRVALRLGFTSEKTNADKVLIYFCKT